MIFHTGIVSMDNIVDATTSLVANNSSACYLLASMLVVAPAGIAVRITHTPVTSDGTENAVHMPYSAAGIRIRRIRL